MQQNPTLGYQHAIAVAPMMDWTDRHCRFFHRQLTRQALLYTEMVVAEAVIHGRRASGCSASIRRSIRSRCSSAAPIPTSSPRRRAIGEAFGYDEINLNVGCPSDRVQSGTFGACLMRDAGAGRRMRRGDEAARSRFPSP